MNNPQTVQTPNNTNILNTPKTKKFKFSHKTFLIISISIILIGSILGVIFQDQIKSKLKTAFPLPLIEQEQERDNVMNTEVIGDINALDSKIFSDKDKETLKKIVIKFNGKFRVWNINSVSTNMGPASKKELDSKLPNSIILNIDINLPKVTDNMGYSGTILGDGAPMKYYDIRSEEITEIDNLFTNKGIYAKQVRQLLTDQSNILRILEQKDFDKLLEILNNL